MLGQGKYDDVCTLAREKAKANGVIVIIFGGDRGNGFSVQAELAMVMKIPELMRAMADQIERDLKEMSADA